MSVFPGDGPSANISCKICYENGKSLGNVLMTCGKVTWSPRGGGTHATIYIPIQ